MDPFPHVVVHDALPQDICDKLMATFPSAEDQGINSKLNNVRWSTKARDIGQVRGLHEIWKAIIHFHTSNVFLDQFFHVFGDALLQLYPQRFPTKLSMNAVSASVRDLSSLSKTGLSLDAQISGNTPVITASAPRGIHVDAPNALYGGLYYLRHPADDSVGGDLQLWKWKDDYDFSKKSGEYREGVLPRHVNLVKTIPYQSNTLVFFLNSLDSLHSVTERQPTVHTRRFINLLADSSMPFFQLKPSPQLRLRNYVKRKLISP